MVCTNADGPNKVPRWIVEKSAQPRCFSGVKLHRLRTQYRGNDKAWVTMVLFFEWPKWFSKRLRHGRKLALILDNFSGHKVPIADVPSNIQITFLPLNTTSYL